MNDKKEQSEILSEITKQAQEMGRYKIPDVNVDSMSWEDCPHLFFGFNILSKGYPNKQNPNIVDGHFLDCYKDYMSEEEREQCTLIARSVEDMSHEELAEMLSRDTVPGDYGNDTLEDWRTSVIDRCQDGDLYRGDMIYLLSKRVYPFNQDHFNKSIVTKPLDS